MGRAMELHEMPTRERLRWITDDGRHPARHGRVRDLRDADFAAGAIAALLAVADVAPMTAVGAERIRQDSKWGPVKDRPVTFPEWLAILSEELGEASRACLEGDEKSLRAELIQVAAVAVAMVESFEAGYCRSTAALDAAMAKGAER